MSPFFPRWRAGVRAVRHGVPRLPGPRGAPGRGAEVRVDPKGGPPTRGWCNRFDAIDLWGCSTYGRAVHLGAQLYC
eukprot:9483293-Pyramimonas_sp.AAC.1